MTSKKKYTLITALFVIILTVVSIYLYREYHRKPADLSQVKPDIIVNAANLVKDYDENELRANEKYIGKIVETSGKIVEINDQYDSLINVILGNAVEIHKVSCMLDKHYLNEVKIYKPGENITIKGVCTGFLIDVELNRCVIVRQN